MASHVILCKAHHIHLLELLSCLPSVESLPHLLVEVPCEQDSEEASVLVVPIVVGSPLLKDQANLPLVESGSQHYSPLVLLVEVSHRFDVLFVLVEVRADQVPPYFVDNHLCRLFLLSLKMHKSAPTHPAIGHLVTFEPVSNLKHLFCLLSLHIVHHMDGLLASSYSIDSKFLADCLLLKHKTSLSKLLN